MIPFTSMEELIKDITLSEEEKEQALREWKIRKYFREKHGHYWEERNRISREAHPESYPEDLKVKA